MYIPDIYDEVQLRRYLNQQQKKAWDLEKDINWNLGIDLNKFFVPLDPKNVLFPNATQEERVVIGQFLGLIINSTVCELERALMRSKAECWDKLMNDFPVNPELELLGEEFFADEEKHAVAFERYLGLFANEVNVSVEELRGLLPIFNHSKIESLFKVNGLAGGHALWWVVAAVEEESIQVFRAMRPFEKDIDPLFYQLHRLHFEEEVRHAAYAFLMLELFRKRAKTPLQLVAKKLDFIFSDVMQLTWVLSQLSKGPGVKQFRDRHPFFEHLHRLFGRMEEKSKISIVKTLFTSAPYINLILNPQSNAYLMKAIKEANSLYIPRSGPQEVDLSCQTEDMVV